MVNYLPAALDATFGALADPTRRAILARLARGESSVTGLAEPFDISLPGILKHLHVLEDAGLVRCHKDGRVNRCRLVAEPMKDAAAWIAYYQQFWEHQFDALAHFLDESQRKEKPSWQRRYKGPNQSSKSGARLQRRGKRSTRRGPSAHD